jgi:hypothetical protein
MDDVPAESSGNANEERPRTKEEWGRELDRMAANVRWLRVWGHLRVRPPTVSRDQALELAREVAETMSQDVGAVVDSAELTDRGSRFPCIYNVDLSDCWIAYLAPLRVGLGSSEIIVIDRKTGAVRYIGSANDEG